MRFLLAAFAIIQALGLVRPIAGVIAYRRGRRTLKQQRADVLAIIAAA